MATVKIYKGSSYMKNSYNNSRAQLSNMSFLFICKYMISYCKSRHAGNILEIYGSVMSVLHQKKALHNFGKRRQPSIAERNIDLEYALACLLLFSLYFYSQMNPF